MPKKPKQLINRPKIKVKDNKTKFFIHKTAVVEDSVTIGADTKIWHFSQVRRGTTIGQNCVIGKSVFIDFESELGDNVKIQNHAIIYHKAIIENGVFIGPNVCFTNDKNPRAINPDGTIKTADDWHITTIKIGQGAAIGGHSVILPGINIGKFAMSGSGSVITKDVPDFALVFGNPARIRGFVCKCGQVIKKFTSQNELMIGNCDCGLSVEIPKDIYAKREIEKVKKKIWIR